MPTLAPTHPYKHHRFSGEIMSHAVWLYCRFPLSHRDVEEWLFVRGVIVSYEAIRTWCRKFGQAYAHALRISGGQLTKRAMSSISPSEVVGTSKP
jgi:transposase-like protein